MEDPYWRYGASADRAGSIPRSSFPGYLPSEPSALTSHHPSVTPHPGAYGLDNIMGIGTRAEPGVSGLAAGSATRGYPPLQDPVLLGQRPDVAVGIGSSIPDLINGRTGSLVRVDGIPVPAKESNILFVDGLPSDSSRREVGPKRFLEHILEELLSQHLFRPFIGFKDIRVVHKEPRQSGDKAMVLCFVEFEDAKCALTALEALQGYKFDNKNPDSPVLKIHFAHFPFRLPSDRGDPFVRS